MFRTQSQRATGPSTWASVEISIMAFPRRLKPNLAWASPTTSSPPTRSSAFPMRELWRAPSTRIWCFPALDARIPWSARFSSPLAKDVPIQTEL